MVSVRASLTTIAALALTLPAYAAATQVVLPGLVEEVVEGHTVFAVVEKVRFENRTVEAAAVAVLVRERSVSRSNFKGVLWFNDQYLVSPTYVNRTSFRYPCGGSILAVNAGDPDPRTMSVSYNRVDQVQVRDDRADDPYDTLGQEDAAYEDPDPGAYRQSADYSNLGRAHRRDYDNGAAIDDAGTPGATPGSFQPRANSWLDVDDDYNRVTSSTVTGVLNYVESYLVTDPNDHAWVVDKYDGISTVSVDLDAVGGVAITTSRFPVWAVNVLGRSAFVPDDGERSCPPFTDDPWGQSRLYSTHASASAALCSVTGSPTVPDACPTAPPGLGADTDGDGIPTDGWDSKPPILGYYEPTDPATGGGASYCYDGNERQGPNVGVAPGSGCGHSADANPLRIYNAVLYFMLGPEDVYVTGADPHGASDTNACEETPSYNGLYGPIGKAPTEWLCPGGDEHAEGNSHPFNPPGVYVPTAFDPVSGGPIGGTGRWHDVWSWNRECSLGYAIDAYGPIEADGKSECDPAEHAIHNRGFIDVYYSPVARPFEPPVRAFAVLDHEGSLDEFHENNAPQPRPHPENVPPDADVDVLGSAWLSES